MEIEKFIVRFAESMDIDADDVSEEMIFKNHPNWDSMTILSVIVMIDEYYSVVITGEELQSVETVKELFELILVKFKE